MSTKNSPWEIEVNEIVEVEVANYAILRIACVTSITNDGNNFNVEFRLICL